MMAIFCICNIFFFSVIGHKEARFMLPVVPFMFLITSNGCLELILRFKKTSYYALRLYIFVEVMIFVYRANLHDQFYDALPYITNDPDSPPHSLYTMHRFEAAYSSWLH